MTFRKLLVEFSTVFLLSWAIEFLYMGIKGVFEGTTLSLLEISLSFDNAVMNAVILTTMSQAWRRKFLTWGIIIAVFGMRFLFPVLIVSLTTNAGVSTVIKLAFSNPQAYGHHLHAAQPLILASGGSFLLMVFINWLFDAGKHLHWIKFLEEKAVKLAKLGNVKLIVALMTVVVIGYLRKSAEIILAMLIGILLFEVVQFIKEAIKYLGKNSKSIGNIGKFIYLELLDASCSLDGTIGAFAVSQNLIIITLGLSIGALIVRSLTVYVVELDKLQRFPYLEHGAHWGIGGLGIMMLFELFHHVPEPIISTVALAFILSSLYSSLKRAETSIRK